MTQRLGTPLAPHPLSTLSHLPLFLSYKPERGIAVAAGVLSVDVLSLGGVSTSVTFGEMTEANLDGCTEVDGVMGMGLTDEDERNVFEDMVEVRCKASALVRLSLG